MMVFRKISDADYIYAWVVCIVRRAHRIAQVTAMCYK